MGWRADETHPPTYIADDHFDVVADEEIARYDDPTPEIEARQDALLVMMLRETTDSDKEVLESLVTDGSGQHPEALASNTDHSISTIYRVLNRLDGIIKNDNASVGWASQKFAEEITELVESAEYNLENTAERIAKVYRMDARQAASSAFQLWLNKYAAELEQPPGEDGPMKIRIDTLLSRLKSGSRQRVDDILEEGALAWKKMGRDPKDFRMALVRWKMSADSYEVGAVDTVLR